MRTPRRHRHHLRSLPPRSCKLLERRTLEFIGELSGRCWWYCATNQHEVRCSYHSAARLTPFLTSNHSKLGYFEKQLQLALSALRTPKNPCIPAVDRFLRIAERPKEMFPPNSLYASTYLMSYIHIFTLVSRAHLPPSSVPRFTYM